MSTALVSLPVHSLQCLAGRFKLSFASSNPSKNTEDLMNIVLSSKADGTYRGTVFTLACLTQASK